MRARNEHTLPISYQKSDNVNIEISEHELKALVTASDNSKVSYNQCQLTMVAVSQIALLIIMAFTTFSIAVTTQPTFFLKSDATQYQLNEIIESTFNPCADETAGPVLEGWDVTSYFHGEPVVGNAEHSATYEGYTFHFKSELSKSMFESNPTSFLPQYGGFCTYGVAWERFWTASTFAADGNPHIYKIINGKLYIFRDLLARDTFIEKNMEEGVEAGDKNWASWYGDRVVYDTECFFNHPQ
eukprot:CAMPEP_0113944352 /NCGR_PEP_ID=MMETSP1339-20121228/33671_1 /TAXON_ID=94617 /ORGANISM="Fibrocapsa japonica" /LENGTH=241 /DNA_ID=CAMNT_0000949529 /DNA_START=33 /DNA_END=758 /DNA_ORIENTATION=+ /assembly_acc=CAM_ASM_000762